ncbi:hypothetical protein [Entomomonas asaccharolytica]|uniref:Uncharacterized protein n=1 Tax=Entomomonas asaccharolytica TaxID=2785331 RepID=A0A974NGM9_9GAMM|nr:hypothetical protein [Entomomonas asaccharolytica]QQP86430.1 hypothetical protein JHT90_04100 [Entomomonas asaccharolytica]
MAGYKASIDFEKLIFVGYSSNGYDLDGIKYRISQVVDNAGRANKDHKQMGKPLYEVAFELLNLQVLGGNEFRDLLNSLPDLTQSDGDHVYEGISYTIKIDIYKFRDFNQSYREIADIVLRKGGKIEVYAYKRTTSSEAGDFLDVDFPVDYSSMS